MQKFAGLPRQRFPLPHDLLRKYRDDNHHNGYHPFAPYRSGEVVNFFIWPVLRTIEAVKQTHPEWCRCSTDETLGVLLKDNQQYMTNLSEQAKNNLDSTGAHLRFHQDYRMGEIGFGSVKAQN
jgi:hypothetical protein